MSPNNPVEYELIIHLTKYDVDPDVSLDDEPQPKFVHSSHMRLTTQAELEKYLEGVKDEVSLAFLEDKESKREN